MAQANNCAGLRESSRGRTRIPGRTNEILLLLSLQRHIVDFYYSATAGSPGPLPPCSCHPDQEPALLAAATSPNKLLMVQSRLEEVVLQCEGLFHDAPHPRHVILKGFLVVVEVRWGRVSAAQVSKRTEAHAEPYVLTYS